MKLVANIARHRYKKTIQVIVQKLLSTKEDFRKIDLLDIFTTMANFSHYYDIYLKVMNIVELYINRYINK